MDQWEYLIVYVNTPYGWEDSAGGKGKDGTELTRLNQLGAERWQIAGIAGSDMPQAHRIYLKRPKAR